ncbi:MAG: hypothetical protein AAGF72_01870 [Pseudomonadota bacterium]
MKSTFVVAAMLLVGTMNPLFADDKDNGDPTRHEKVPLTKLLDVVSRDTGKDFLIDARVPTEVVVGTLAMRDVDYNAFATILRNNSLAAVDAEKTIKIVPSRIVRQQALPLVSDSDPSIPGDAWVTRMVFVENANAGQLVPILRPMIQQEGHLVGMPAANMLLIVAPYGVSEQLVKIARAIDENHREMPPGS